MNYVELIITTDIKIDRDQFKTSTLSTATAIFLKIDNICKINHETVSDLQYNKSQNTLNYVNSKLFLSIRRYLALLFITTVFLR